MKDLSDIDLKDIDLTDILEEGETIFGRSTIDNIKFLEKLILVFGKRPIFKWICIGLLLIYIIITIIQNNSWVNSHILVLINNINMSQIHILILGFILGVNWDKLFK